MRNALAAALGGCVGAVAGTFLLAAAVRRAGAAYDRQHAATRKAAAALRAVEGEEATP